MFLEKPNNFHPSIKFSCEYSCKKVYYLDVQVIVREGKLITNLYVNQMDSHQSLDPSSCHPYHCTKSIPYSQALRVNRVCLKNLSPLIYGVTSLKSGELKEITILRGKEADS